MKRFTTMVVMLCALVSGAFAEVNDTFQPTEGKYYSFRHAYYGQYVSFGPDVKVNDILSLSGADDADGVWGFSAFKLTATDDGYFYISLTADPDYYVYVNSGAGSTTASKNYVYIGEKPSEFTDGYKWKIVEKTPTNGSFTSGHDYGNTLTDSGVVYAVYNKLSESINGGWNFYGGYNASTSHNVCIYSSANSQQTSGYDADLGSLWVVSEATFDASSSDDYTNAVNAATTDLANNGVGYPTDNAAVRTALSAAKDSLTAQGAASTEGAWKKYQALKNATTAYEAETTDVNLPADGKVYKVYVQITTTDDDGNTVVTKYPVTFDDKGKANVSSDTDATASSIVIQKTVTTDGKTKYYLGALDGQNTLYFRNNETTTTDGNLFDIDASGTQGTVTLYGHTGNNTGSSNPKGETSGAYRYLVANANGAWDQSTGTTQFTSNGSIYSPLFVFEEVTDAKYTLNVKMQVTEKATEEFEKYLYFATVNLPYTVTLPSSLTAYKAEYKAQDATVTLTKLTLTDNVLPFETPVIVSAANSGTYDLTPAAYTAAAETGFKGTLYAKTTSSSNVYVFGKKDGVVQFWNVSNGYNMTANKAYLELENASAANGLKFVFADQTTGIDAVSTDTDASAATYDLSGRRVYAPVKGGLYIKNGKKVVF